MAILMFFVLGALLVISNNGLTLAENENLGEFSDLYVKWIDKVFNNVKGITGNVVKLDWGTS